MEKKMSYQKFKNLYKEPKYFGTPCIVIGCNRPAEYEGGDARFYCGVCEKHSNIYDMYILYKKRFAPTYNVSPQPIETKIIYENYKF